jgi:hypothetical protein
VTTGAPKVMLGTKWPSMMSTLGASATSHRAIAQGPYVKPIGTLADGVGACPAQLCKVGGEDRGRDDGGRRHGGRLCGRSGSVQTTDDVQQSQWQWAVAGVEIWV